MWHSGYLAGCQAKSRDDTQHSNMIVLLSFITFDAVILLCCMSSLDFACIQMYYYLLLHLILWYLWENLKKTICHWFILLMQHWGPYWGTAGRKQQSWDNMQRNNQNRKIAPHKTWLRYRLCKTSSQVKGCKFKFHQETFL